MNNLPLNNPGNITYGAFARKYGATGSDPKYHRFAVFPDMVTGLRAHAELLLAYSQMPDGHGGRIDTVREAISRWCPPSGPGGESQAATDHYIQFVCDQLSTPQRRVSPDDEFDFDYPFLFWMVMAQGELEQGSANFNAAVTDAQISEAVRLALAT